jgi:hypothetical protein
MAYDEAKLLAALDRLPPLAAVQRDTAEWDYMWERLGQHSLNQDQERPTSCLHQDSHEVWQYMGSAYADGRWSHQFRHRFHPATGQREYVNVPASLAWVRERVLE